MESAVISNIETNSDSLKKYSYLLTKYYQGFPVSRATAFFVRGAESVYLVSNYHVFTGTDMAAKQKRSGFVWDDMKVMIPGHGEFSIKMNWDSIINETTIFRANECPDIYCQKMNELAGLNIHSVESFLSTYNIKRGNPERVLWYGFEEHATDGPVEYTGRMLNPIAAELYLKDIGESDPFNNAISTTSSEGNSGAPLFFIYKDLITFGGVMSSTIKNAEGSIAVRPEYVIDLIKRQ
jgi:hypothetical protein